MKSAFLLFDLEERGDGHIELDEWKAFCRGSVELGNVQQLLSDFFNFVSVNGDEFIHFNELNEALNYLGKPSLSKNEQKIISRISLSPDEFNAEEMIIFVSAEMLKKIVQHEIKYDGPQSCLSLCS